MTLTNHKYILLLWTSRNKGIAGNERADSLAKKGSEPNFHWTEASTGSSQKYDKPRLKVDKAKIHNKME